MDLACRSTDLVRQATLLIRFWGYDCGVGREHSKYARLIAEHGSAGCLLLHDYLSPLMRASSFLAGTRDWFDLESDVIGVLARSKVGDDDVPKLSTVVLPASLGMLVRRIGSFASAVPLHKAETTTLCLLCVMTTLFVEGDPAYKDARARCISAARACLAAKADAAEK